VQLAKFKLSASTHKSIQNRNQYHTLTNGGSLNLFVISTLLNHRFEYSNDFLNSNKLFKLVNSKFQHFFYDAEKEPCGIIESKAELRRRTTMQKRLVIIDGNSLINRAFFAIQQRLTNKDGVPTNAVYGFLNMLFRVMEDYKPDFMSVAFDMKAPTFRHTAYSDYKGTRKGMPDELAVQLPILKEILDAMGIHRTELSGFEADDLIGTISKRFGANGHEVLSVTGDKDALQLVDENITVLITKQGISQIDVMTPEKVMADFELTPAQIIDLKGLSGDTSDNIPGIPSVGPKTATKLLKTYETVERLIEEYETIENKRIRELVAEYAHQAMMSKKLATIEINVPLEFDEDDFKCDKPDTKELVNLLMLYELKSFIPRISTAEIETEKPELVLTFVEQPLELPLYVEKLSAWHAAGIYMLVDKANVVTDEPIGIAVSSASGEVFYFDFSKYSFADFLAYYGDWLMGEKVELSGYDLKKEWLICFAHKQAFKGKLFDAFIAHYLLAAGNSSYSVDETAYEYLNLTIDSDEQVIGKGVKTKKLSQLSLEEASIFAANRAYVCMRLNEKMKENMVEEGLLSLFETVEMPLVEVLASMEYEGFNVDQEELASLNEAVSTKLIEIEKDIYAFVDEPFNLNSPKQLGEVLFDKLGLPHGKKTKTGYSTNVDVLDKLKDSHPIVPLVLEYRTYAKLKSTYLDGLKAVINPTTQKIHSSLKQTVAVTGRLSSTEPNLQNIPVRIPLGRMIRKVFVPSKGNVLVDADYSQIELRILAHYSEDPNLVKAFREGLDIHTMTASQVFNIPPERITSLERSRAKEVNFGIVYGMSDYGLAENLSIPRKTAKLYIDSYFENYPNVKAFMDGKIQECRDQGYVTTILGRKRFIPDIQASNFNVRGFAERTAMNTPIQGSAADLIKLAMIMVYNEIKEKQLKSRLILQVHDELIVDTTPDELEVVDALVKANMEGAMSLLVPMLVEIHSGPSWYETK
jgi:DNA polymerase-1